MIQLKIRKFDFAVPSQPYDMYRDFIDYRYVRRYLLAGLIIGTRSILTLRPQSIRRHILTY